jgi:putative hemolysin
VTEEEIKAIVQEGTEVGEVQEIEQDILERVFHVGDRKVSSLMTHRTDIITLDKDATAEEVRASVLQELHSVYPVVNETIDDVIGCVQLKDLFAHIRDEDFSLQKYVKTPVYIIEQTPAYKALEQFKSSQVHYAIVTDEYGMTQGILTLNDILEALVGNISEFYGEEFSLVRREDGSWLIDGLYPFPDFLRYFDLTELTNEYPHNTLSGLILHELGHIPKPGEIVMWMNFKFEIVDMDGVKIDKILIRKMG